MARLPSALDLGQRPTPEPSATVIPLRATNGAEAAPGLAMAHVGNSLEHTSNQLYGLAKYEQEKSDHMSVEDAVNRARDVQLDLTRGEKNGFLNFKGGDAINKPLFTDYTAKLDDAAKGISSGLQNDNQRQLFDQKYRGMVRQQFLGSLANHLQQERQHFDAAVYPSTVASEANVIGTQYANENAFALSLTRMFDGAKKEVSRKGLTDVPGALDTENQNVIDKAWVARLNAWQADDPAGAYAAFQQNAAHMSPAVRLHMKNQLAGAALPAIAAGEVSRGSPVVRQIAPQPGAPIPGPTKVSPAVEKFAGVIDTNSQQYGVDPGVMRRQLQVESAGNPNARNDADIRVTGSPSIGIAQFQPATAKRYGIDPTDPVQSIRGQAAYMADLLKMFDGDYQKALAGYNWGEGNVQKAVAAKGDKWMESAPASTRAYIQKIVGSEQRGFGNRPDGTPKGNGFLGVLKTPAGNVATEYSVGVQIDGKEIDVPTLVPTLTQAEVQQVLKAADGNGDISDAIVEKAAAHARMRIATGKVVFADAPQSGANRAADYASMSPAQMLTLKTGNPVIDAMPADDKLRTLSLIHSEALRQRQEKQALLGTREQDARASFYVNGTATNAPTTGELVDAYGPIEGMKRARGLDEAQQTGQAIQQMSALPTAEIQRALTQKPAEGEGFADRQKAYELKLNAAHRIVSARQADPIAYALSTKSYGIQPLTPETLSPQQLPAFADELRRRTAAAPRIANDYGTAPLLLTKGEGQALAGVLKSAPSEITKQYLAAIYNGVGDMNAYKSVMGAIAPDAPVIAQAGVMQARNAQSTGRPGSGPDYPALPVRDVAGMILDGYRLMNPDRKQDGKEHEGSKGLVRMPSGDQEKLMRDDFDRTVGGAYQNSPQARDVAWQTARAIYAKKTQEDNDQTGNHNRDRWESAINLATGGGALEHNGQKVIPPQGWTIDMFRDALRVRAAEIAPQTRLSVNEIMSLPLRNTGDGEYEVLAGSGVLRDKAGRKVLIELTEQAPAAAGSRVPGARLAVPQFGVTHTGAVTGLRR